MGTLGDVSFDDREPLEVYAPLIASLVVSAVAYSGLALAAVALLGRVVGPAVSSAVGFVIMVFQAGEAPVAPMWGGAGDPPYELHTEGVLAAAVLLGIGLAVWSRSRAAASQAS